MCDKTLDVFLPTLKFISYWFVTSKMIKKLDEVLFSNDATIFVKVGSNHVTFFSDEMGVLGEDLNNINLDHVNFDQDNPETIIHVRLMACRNRIKQCKISKELMPVA